MAGRIFARLAQMLLVLFAISFASYGLIGLMPGDPIDLMVASDPALSSADIARLKALHGLDRPLLERYGAWLLAALSGDFGYSRLYSAPALEVALSRIGPSLALMGASLLLSAAIALPLGMAAALRPQSAFDHLASGLAFVGVSTPVFWLALVAIHLFSVELRWLPASAAGVDPEEGLAQTALRMVLPVCVLATVSTGIFLRFVRAAMMDALREPFVRTARAKGCSAARALFVHALPAAAPPLITIAALEFGALFSGALVVETVFAYPGMGKLIYDAIMGNDYNVALLALTIATAAVLLANLAADLAHAGVDPRVRDGLLD